MSLIGSEKKNHLISYSCMHRLSEVFRDYHWVLLACTIDLGLQQPPNLIIYWKEMIIQTASVKIVSMSIMSSPQLGLPVSKQATFSVAWITKHTKKEKGFIQQVVMLISSKAVYMPTESELDAGTRGVKAFVCYTQSVGGLNMYNQVCSPRKSVVLCRSNLNGRNENIFGAAAARLWVSSSFLRCTRKHMQQMIRKSFSHAEFLFKANCFQQT